MDYLKLYDLEGYLFQTVRDAYRTNGKLNAFDFFCIVIWKANRAKSKVAVRLLAKDKKERKDLNAITERLTAEIYNAKDRREQMRVLIQDWGFRLPMASAILTVLHPLHFTVYDKRVCSVLGKYDEVQNKTRFDDLWQGYENFLEAMKKATPPELSLRDKDRYLWAMSFAQGLSRDIQNLFQEDEGDTR